MGRVVVLNDILVMSCMEIVVTKMVSVDLYQRIVELDGE